MYRKQLIQLMRIKAEAVQAVVVEIENQIEAFQYSLALTEKQGGCSMAAAGFDQEEMNSLRPLCADAGIELLDSPLRDHAGGFHTAVTPVDWGIAETGTLVLDSSAEDMRLATMLAETHVALLPVSQIKPDTESLEHELDAVIKKDPSAYLAFITGASRTADIERVLAIGVHGPQELHILLMS